jgi:hypothetical protein
MIPECIHVLFDFLDQIKTMIVLHIACLNDQYKICFSLFHHIKTLNIEEERIKKWVNSPTDEGFMPIHFASYKGNIVKLT